MLTYLVCLPVDGVRVAAPAPDGQQPFGDRSTPRPSAPNWPSLLIGCVAYVVLHNRVCGRRVRDLAQPAVRARTKWRPGEHLPAHVTLAGVEPASRRTQGVSNEPRERTTASDHECFGGEVLEVRACAAELDERCTAV